MVAYKSEDILQRLMMTSDQQMANLHDAIQESDSASLKELRKVAEVICNGTLLKSVIMPATAMKTSQYCLRASHPGTVAAGISGSLPRMPLKSQDERQLQIKEPAPPCCSPPLPMRLLEATGKGRDQGLFPKASLQQHLLLLQDADGQNVVTVRKIHRLGFAAPEILKSHYSKFGTVSAVHVPMPKAKVPKRASKHSSGVLGNRLRPSPIGFIVMNNAADAQAVLAAGEDQFLYSDANGWLSIEVRCFEHRNGPWDLASGGDVEEETSFDHDCREDVHYDWHEKCLVFSL
jgi:hypothetical protein